MAYERESRGRDDGGAASGGGTVAPGKATRTQSLGAKHAVDGAGGGAVEGYAFYPDWDEAGGAGGANGAGAHGGADDPFGLHLTARQRPPGDATAANEEAAPTGAALGATDHEAGHAVPATAPGAAGGKAAAGGPAASDASGSGAAAGSEAAVGDDAGGEVAAGDPGGEVAPVDGDTETATPGEPVAAADGDDAPESATGATDEVADASPSIPSVAAPPPASTHPHAATAAPADNEPNAADVARIQAGLIQAHASSEYLQAVTAIGQREQLLRGALAHQRGAILTLSATQMAMVRADAKTTAERIRGRNGLASRAIGQVIDGEVTRISLGTQDALVRMSNASAQVRPALFQAAENALPNANLDLRDGVEGQLANDLYHRLIPKAQTAAREEHHNARDREIRTITSTRDANIRQMRQAGQVLASQVDAKLRDVERAILASGEAVAAAIDRNAKSQLAALDATQRQSGAFFARARLDARRIVDGGSQAAAALTSAGGAQAGQPGAGARFQSAAALVAPQFSAQRERLVSGVDGVIGHVTSVVGKGLGEFQAECGIQRAMALGNHAVVEGKLAGEVATKTAAVKTAWAKDTDQFIISVNTFAGRVEANRAQLIAQLPGKFGGILRSAVLEARKSRIEKVGEGLWDAVSGLVVTVAKFVAVTLAILAAPFAFGIAALLGKAGELAGLFRDVALAVVGTVEAFAERFKILFRTWDDWPWYAKVAGLWSTTLLAIGDIVGLPSIFEGATGRELMSNRELTDQERGGKAFGGGLAAMTTFVPAKLHADKLAAAEAKAAMSTVDQAGAVVHEPPMPALAEAPAVVDDLAGAQARQQVILQGGDLEIAEAARRVKPEPGTLDVFIHGEVDEFVVFDADGAPMRVNHRSLARYIEKSGKDFRKVRLIACKSGMHPQGAAQHLTNKLHVDLIEAPTDKVHIHVDGTMTIGPSDTVNSGKWETFRPKKSEFRYTPYREPVVTETRYERFLRERAEKADAAAAQADGPAPHAEPGADDIALSPPAPEPPTGGAKAMGRSRGPRSGETAESLFDEREPGSSVMDEPDEFRHGDDPADHVPDSDDAGDLGLARGDGRRVRHVPRAEAPAALGQEAGAGVLVDTRLGITRAPRHHVLPQAELEFFQERGFPGRDIDNFTVEMSTPAHEEVHGVNQAMARRYWPEREWNTALMKRLEEREAVKMAKVRRRLRPQRLPKAEVREIVEAEGRLTRDEIWEVVNEQMAKFQIDDLPFVKYNAPEGVPVGAPPASAPTDVPPASNQP